MLLDTHDYGSSFHRSYQDKLKRPEERLVENRVPALPSRASELELYNALPRGICVLVSSPGRFRGGRFHGAMAVCELEGRVPVCRSA